MATCIKIGCWLILVVAWLPSGAQRDTVSAYQMGGIERLDGLSYGSEHTLVLFSDSSFTYHIEHANQISTSEEMYATGTWMLANDTLHLIETPGSYPWPRMRFSNCIYNEYRKDLILTFSLGECITCDRLTSVVVYNKGHMSTHKLQITGRAYTDKQKQLSRPVRYLTAATRAEVTQIDSLQIDGVVIVPNEKKHNEIDVYFRPVFNLCLAVKGSGLQVVATSIVQDYTFRKIR
ncbi:MAG: hypothetical protein ACHQF2_05040 [Flavobacteriales bacterium]